ncbi:MAG: flagellar export chaperone FliS [Oscillospiraceae bacterium]
MAINPYERYKQQSVMTMTQGEMLIKLWDETLKQLSSGVIFIEKKDFSQSNKALQKAQQIINHLRATLNFKYEMSNDLDALYEFFISKIVEANIQKASNPIEEILPMITELRDSFAQAERSARMK